MRTNFLLAMCFLTLSGCMSRADSTNELDRAQGLLPVNTEANAKTRTESLVAVDKEVTTQGALSRAEPQIVRVWIHDFEVGNDFRIQGTWADLVIEPGHWTPRQPAQKNEK